jgi:hypothetical protein
MKVCDIADWFTQDLDRIIANEIRELPRFHRKQWEFAKIFQTLRDMGVLHPDSVGISFGAGRERLMYALAPHVGRLWASDQYDQDSNWWNARTADIDAYIRDNPPFPTPTDHVSG